MTSSKENVDFIAIQINQKLANRTITTSEQCIDKVRDGLRKQNINAYEPLLVSIGPYHREKINLKAMENQKLSYLQSLLERNQETSVDRYVIALKTMEERARHCYAAPVSLNQEDFIEMMLLDGCFIIELFHKWTRRKRYHLDDKVFQVSRLHDEIRNDLLLLENQLPFFVLDELFNMTKIDDEDIIDMALSYLDELVPGPSMEPVLGKLPTNFEHLLGLIHECWCSPFIEKVKQKGDEFKQRKVQKQVGFMKSAVELEEAGICFEMASIERVFFDIDFNKNKKVFKIPELIIDDFTEAFFRNMIAYEQQRYDMYPMFVTDYIVVMDFLVNTSRDVRILRECRAIENQLEDDEVVANLLNKLGIDVNFSSEDDQFSYPGLFADVNEHCEHRANKWMATLRRDYFNTPWALISFLAAVVLLLLTIIQTICSVLSV